VTAIIGMQGVPGIAFAADLGRDYRRVLEEIGGQNRAFGQQAF
jgi:hypothetical protein